MLSLIPIKINSYAISVKYLIINMLNRNINIEFLNYKYLFKDN